MEGGVFVFARGHHDLSDAQPAGVMFLPASIPMRVPRARM